MKRQANVMQNGFLSIKPIASGAEGGGFEPRRGRHSNGLCKPLLLSVCIVPHCTLSRREYEIDSLGLHQRTAAPFGMKRLIKSNLRVPPVLSA